MNDSALLNDGEYIVKETIEDQLRRRLLAKMDDLRHKIATNEDMPELKQDVGFLIEVSDNLENILNSWYY